MGTVQNVVQWRMHSNIAKEDRNVQNVVQETMHLNLGKEDKKSTECEGNIRT